ncbi:uncharacterized protein [Dermacentor andersoni]|uniref:uncharacterized protein n=1 Tax=Dermacentor andersoni TaxID=34620 RepID=UPI0024167D7C|nr:uncharacterized protein LOC126536627 [Dermacentor andersoni]
MNRAAADETTEITETTDFRGEKASREGATEKTETAVERKYVFRRRQATPDKDTGRTGVSTNPARKGNKTVTRPSSASSTADTDKEPAEATTPPIETVVDSTSPTPGLTKKATKKTKASSATKKAISKLTTATTTPSLTEAAVNVTSPTARLTRKPAKKTKASTATKKAIAKLSTATTTSSKATINVTSPPARLTKKPVKETKTSRASKMPIAKLTITTTKKLAKARKKTTAQGLPPELGKRPLVCAYGNGSRDAMVFPTDGLCDAVFFDSLYKYPGYVLASVDDGSLMPLRRFLNHARKYKRTRFGMGVAAKYVEMAKAEFLSNTAERHHLPYLWANKVYDLGVLDFIPDETTTDDQVKLVFDLLKDYKQLRTLIPMWSGLKAYVVLGIALFKKYDSIYEAFKSRMGEKPVDVLILRTHFSGRDDAREDCVIQGSTYWKGSLTQYHPSLNYTLMYMGNNKETLASTKTLISMSLAGRWYRSKVGGQNKSAYMIGVRCKPYMSEEYLYELQSFTYITEHPSYGPNHTFFDEKRFVMVSYDPVKGYALIFDSAATIYMKMCLSYTDQGALPFGLALFDAEYDDWSKKVNNTGGFPLIRSARKALNDIENNTAGDSTKSMKCVAPK